MQIGINIKRRRCDSGMTQKRLAESSSVPQARISAYETGKITPSLVTLAAIADALSCSVSDLVEVAE